MFSFSNLLFATPDALEQPKEHTGLNAELIKRIDNAFTHIKILLIENRIPDDIFKSMPKLKEVWEHKTTLPEEKYIILHAVLSAWKIDSRRNFDVTNRSFVGFMNAKESLLSECLKVIIQFRMGDSPCSTDPEKMSSLEALLLLEANVVTGFETKNENITKGIVNTRDWIKSSSWLNTYSTDSIDISESSKSKNRLFFRFMDALRKNVMENVAFDEDLIFDNISFDQAKSSQKTWVAVCERLLQYPAFHKSCRELLLIIEKRVFPHAYWWGKIELERIATPELKKALTSIRLNDSPVTGVGSSPPPSVNPEFCKQGALEQKKSIKKPKESFVTSCETSPLPWMLKKAFTAIYKPKKIVQASAPPLEQHHDELEPGAVHAVSVRQSGQR